MICYTLSIEKPHRHYLQLECIIPASSDELIVQLPVWRPGRYERGDFAKNIREWNVYGANRENLQYKKINSHRWKIDCAGNSKIKIVYTYYAAVLNAGSTWLDEYQLYVNPVNCFLYIPGDENQEYQVKLNIPKHWRIACGLSQSADREIIAKDTQQMMDSPFICSASLEHLIYHEENIPFHIWIQGDLPVDRRKLLNDFAAFTRSQLDAFESFPVKDYHFLFQTTPYKTYHGVEHENSTVIALGPDHDIVEGKLYEELLGVSCHELYHTWNIKNIRPLEMLPYDFSRENYSELGYVAEGVTTYLGDQFLHRSGIFNDEQYFNELATVLEKHFENAGRFNLSVAQSSYDTWLDGYLPGIPWRKVSIYNEGALCAFLLDVAIISNTGNKSLDDVMNRLYLEYGLKSIGYTSEGYRDIAASICGEDLNWLFDLLIDGNTDYKPYLLKTFDLLGMQMIEKDSVFAWENQWGIRLDATFIIQAILPDSAADKAGLWIGDKILKFNGSPAISPEIVSSEININSYNELEFSSNGIIKKTNIASDPSVSYKKFKIERIAQPAQSQNARFEFWKMRKPFKD